MAHYRRSPRALAAAGALAGLTLLTSACSPDEWGTAARVGDYRLSVADLQADSSAVAAQIAPTTTCGQGTLQNDVLQRAVQLQLVHKAAERNGVSVTEAEIDSFLGGVGPIAEAEKQAAATCVAPRHLRDLVRVIAESQKLEAKFQNSPDPSAATGELQSVASQEGVEVNPRYGRFVLTDSELGVEPLVSGGLAKAATPSASPTAAPSELVPDSGTVPDDGTVPEQGTVPAP